MTVLLVIHLFVTLALIGVILIQHSEGGGLGLGSSSNAFLSARSAANVLTRATGILATLFIGNCLLMTVISSKAVKQQSEIINNVGS